MATGSYLSIITLNVNGLNVPTKRQRLAEWIQKQDPYICCLQETHLKRKTECPQIATIQAPGQHGRWTHSSPPSTYESPSPKKAKDAIISMEGGLGWPQPRFRPQSFVFFQLVLWLAKQVCWMGTAS